MKRIISILLTLVIFISSCAVGTAGIYAAETLSFDDGELRYAYTDDTHTALKVTGRSSKYTNGTISIPDEFNSLPVTEVGKSAFQGGYSVKEINFGENLEIISDMAFYSCEAEIIDLSKTKVNYIGASSFFFSKAKEVILSPYTEKIDSYAFDYCQSGMKVTFNEGIKYISGTAFGKIEYPDDEFYIVGDGILMNYNDKSEEAHCLTLPSEVKSIACAFRGDHAKYVDELYINDECTTVSSYAFEGNKYIKKVHLGKNINTIDNSAFNHTTVNSELESVDGMENVENIGCYAFCNDKKLTSLDLSSVKNISDNAFKQSGLTSAVFSDKLESVGVGVFKSCTWLKSVDFSNKLASIPDETFNGCTCLTELNGVEKITSVGDNAFNQCRNIAEIPFDSRLETIGLNAFASCSSLKSFKFNKNIKRLDGTFQGCTQLEDADISECVNLEQLGATGGVFKNTQIKKADLSDLNKLTFIGNAYANCPNLTEVILPNSVTKIGSSTFAYCKNLKSVQLSNKLTGIGDNAFIDCISLTSLSLPETLSAIGSNCFKGCTNLTDMTLPKGITNLGSGAFYNCIKLKGLYVPQSVKAINSYTFCNTLIEKAEIPDSVTRIQEYAFFGCKKLTDVKFNEGLKYINERAFAGCSIEKINLPKSLTSIGERAFLNPEVSPSELTIDEGNTAFTVYQHSIYSKDLKRLVQYFAKDNEVYVVPEQTTSVNVSYTDRTIKCNSKILLPNTIKASAFTLFGSAFPEGIKLYVTSDSDIYKRYVESGNYSGVSYIIGSNVGKMKMKKLSDVECGVNNNQPGVTVYDSENGEKTLVEGTDYLLYFYGNKEVGSSGVAYAIGINDYEGMAASQTFSVTSNDIKHSAVDLDKKYEFTGEAVTPRLKVTLFGKELTEGTDYEVVFANNDKPGKATATVNGKGEYMGTKQLSFSVVCNHDYDIEETVASCTENGGIKYTCKICGNIDYDITEKKWGHSFETLRQAPTCQKEGFEKKICTTCGYTEETVLSKTSHKYYNTVEYFQPSCTEEGYQIDECIMCGDRIKSVIPAREHRYMRTEQDASCNQDGFIEYTCLDCFYTYIDYYEKANEKYHEIKVDYIEPSCSQTGVYTEYCCLCGKIFVDETLPALSCNYGEWIIDYPATCGENGERHRICKDCGNVQEAIAPATGKHEWTKNITFPASTESNGCTFVSCKHCGKMKYYYYIWRVETIGLKKGGFTYDGKKHKPKVVVKDYQGGVVAPENYKVTYEKRPTSIGLHKVKVQFVGKKYEGTTILTYKINPEGTSVFSAKASKDKINVRINRRSKNADGYQLQLSSDESFKKAKTITLSGNNNTSASLTSEKSRKAYVRVRTYKTVNGKKYYSSWSKPKKA